MQEINNIKNIIQGKKISKSPVEKTSLSIKNTVFAIIFYSIEISSSFCAPIAWFSSFASDNSNFVWKIEDGLNFPKHFYEIYNRQNENMVLIDDLILMIDKYNPSYDELITIINSNKIFSKFPNIVKWVEDLSKIPWLEEDLNIAKKDLLIISKNELNQLNLLNQAKLNYENEKIETISASLVSVFLLLMLKFLAKASRLKDKDWILDSLRKKIYRKFKNTTIK